MHQRGSGITPVRVTERKEGGQDAISRQAENRAVVVGASLIGRAVKNAIGALDHPGLRITTIGVIEGNQGCQCAVLGQAENRAITTCAASNGRAVEVSIFALNQSGVGIGAIAFTGELIQGSDRAGRCHLEHRP